jgi:hypothetical protein
MEKRTVKSKTDLKADLEKQTDKAFLEEYKNLVEPLNQKHGRRLIPMMNYTEQGALPVFGIQRIIKEEVTVQPANEKRQEPEANG